METPEIEPQSADQKQEAIIEDESSVSYLGVKLEKAKGKGNFVPDRANYQDFINDEFALQMQQKIAVSFLQGEPILIEGGTSIGKTTAVRKMCSELGWEVHYANLNGASDVEDLMGRYIPNPDKRGPNDPEYIFADGKVTSGLRQEEDQTKVIILDEFNSASPNILIRMHEILDAIEKGGEVVLSEDASETVKVDKKTTKVIALMNPPGKGYFGRGPIDPAQLRRWIYQKEVTDLPQKTFYFATHNLFGLGAQTEGVPRESYLISRGDTLNPEQLSEIPGMGEILAKYEEFHRAAKEMVATRKVAADQPQPFTFDDRVEPRRVRDFIAKFYNGDINETFGRALRYFYVNKLESKEDRQKLEELIAHVSYTPSIESRRRTLAESAENSTDAFKSRVADELSAIMTDPSIPDSVKKALSAKTELSPDILKQIKEAKEILGKDFLGSEEIKKAFGIETSEIPAIPFSKEELERAKELNQILVLRLPVSMARINEILGGKVKDGGKLLYSFDEATGELTTDCWFRDEDFYKEELTEAKWALVSRENIPNSNSKNYLEQTDLIIDYLKNQVFGVGTLPEEYEQAIDEYQRVRAEIEGLLGSDWQRAAEILEGLKITQLTRQSPTEALYDLALYFQINGERLMPDQYLWTSRRSSVGGLVCLGGFGSGGVGVRNASPDDRYASLGAGFSRSL